MPVHEVAEGEQEIRRGEGLVFKLTTTNWEASPAPADISIIRISDGQDVTGDFTGSATPSVDGNVVTLPEITAPTAAALGRYRVNMPFAAAGFSPGMPYVDLIVIG